MLVVPLGKAYSPSSCAFEDMVYDAKDWSLFDGP